MLRHRRRITLFGLKEDEVIESISFVAPEKSAACHLSDDFRIARIAPIPAGIRIDAVLDTDTYNEIDDQFALAYAMLSPDRINLQAVYAAPFHNDRSSGPEDGMVKSSQEIERVLSFFSPNERPPAFKGARFWFDRDHPQSSDASDDLIERARASTSPLYVIGIAAATNIATALALAPDIKEKIVVVWLGGNPVGWQDPAEFNLYQDPPASRYLLDSGAPIVRIPCMNVAQHLNTTLSEIEAYVANQGSLGDYLASIYRDYYSCHYARSKVIWDIANIAWLIDADWAPSTLRTSPILDVSRNLVESPERFIMRDATYVNRDAVFGDLFRKLEGYAKAAQESNLNFG
jgi:hypothetical protein